jgi:hypothetical protein
MHPDVIYFIILLCLTPEDFTFEGSAATHWVIKHICVHHSISAGLMNYLSSAFCSRGGAGPFVP